MSTNIIAFSKVEAEEIRNALKNTSKNSGNNSLLERVNFFLDMPSFTFYDNNGCFQFSFFKTLSAGDNPKEDDVVIGLEITNDNEGQAMTAWLSEETASELCSSLKELLGNKSFDNQMKKAASTLRASKH